MAYRRFRLRVPRDHQEALRDFVAFSKSKARTIIDGLAATPPSLRFSDFTEAAAERCGVGGSEMEALFPMLLGVYSVLEDEGADDVDRSIDDLLDSLDPTVRKDIKDETSARIRIKELLTLRPVLGTISKGLDLVYAQRGRVFQDARIMTDLRPVFGPETSSIIAGLVLHTICISYTEGTAGTIRQFFAAMDHEDITDLIEVLKRAIRKEAVLKENQRANQLTILETP